MFVRALGEFDAPNRTLLRKVHAEEEQVSWFLKWDNTRGTSPDPSSPAREVKRLPILPGDSQTIRTSIYDYRLNGF